LYRPWEGAGILLKNSKAPLGEVIANSLTAQFLENSFPFSGGLQDSIWISTKIVLTAANRRCLNEKAIIINWSKKCFKK
jgi:hypothetical protein